MYANFFKIVIWGTLIKRACIQTPLKLLFGLFKKACIQTPLKLLFGTRMYAKLLKIIIWGHAIKQCTQITKILNIYHINKNKQVAFFTDKPENSPTKRACTPRAGPIHSLFNDFS